MERQFESLTMGEYGGTGPAESTDRPGAASTSLLGRQSRSGEARGPSETMASVGHTQARVRDVRGVKVLLHDYAGHPFPVGLSHELARRGHSVTHCYDANVVTPHGDLSVGPDDPHGLSIVSLTSGAQLEKHALIKRWRQERAYGRVLARFILDQAPDVVLSANTPLGSQAYAISASRSVGARFVFWVQDLYGIGIDRAVRARIPLAGGMIGRHFLRTEQRLLAASDAVVAISDDFSDFIRKAGVSPPNLTVIENWGPIADFDAADRQSSWKDLYGLAGKFLFLYSGTLGLKHNPELVAAVARAFASDPDVAVVVASEGVGADWLRGLALPNLHVLGFQPYGQLPSMLRSADVLLAVLEPEASVFSVPSKVLTYMCAGRPVLAAIPSENLAARLITRAGAGVVVQPSRSEAFVASARALFVNPELRQSQGQAGRRHAERHFRIEEIANRFEEVLLAPPSRFELAREAA